MRRNYYIRQMNRLLRIMLTSFSWVDALRAWMHGCSKCCNVGCESCNQLTTKIIGPLHGDLPNPGRGSKSTKRTCHEPISFQNFVFAHKRRMWRSVFVLFLVRTHKSLQPPLTVLSVCYSQTCMFMSIERAHWCVLCCVGMCVYVLQSVHTHETHTLLGGRLHN